MHPAEVIGAAILAAALPVAAHANADLAKSKNCMACHSVDKKMVGPAFKDVAAKYKADKEGATKLSHSILKGSSNQWGPIPMPPNPVSDADANALAKWVLSL